MATNEGGATFEWILSWRFNMARVSGAVAFAREEGKREKPPGSGRLAKLSRLKKPEKMELEAWQRELRRQFGREQHFLLTNIGTHPVFSEFHITNPESKNTYRVAIRGIQLGENYCSCPDFTTNALGTCKHVEFTLAALERQRGGNRALRALR
jgi:hypothetical protein